VKVTEKKKNEKIVFGKSRKENRGGAQVAPDANKLLEQGGGESFVKVWNEKKENNLQKQKVQKKKIKTKKRTGEKCNGKKGKPRVRRLK